MAVPLVPIVTTMLKKWIVSRVVREVTKVATDKATETVTRVVGGRMLKGYKTVTFNVAGAIVVVAGLLGFDLGTETAALLAGVIIPAVNVALRVVTDTPIFRKD